MATARIVAACVLATGCGRLSFERPDAGGTPDGASMTGDGPSGDGVARTPGCQAGEVSAAQTESFDTSLPAWADVYNPTGVTLIGGAMELAPILTQQTVFYSGIIENPRSDHRGQRILVEVPQMLPSRAGVQALFRIVAGDSWTQFYVETDKLHVESQGGTGLSSFVPYDPVAHRWWQLHDNGVTVSFDVSPDGVVWTPIFAVPTPAYYADSSIEIAAGYYQTQNMPLGAARFDNLFVCD